MRPLREDRLPDGESQLPGQGERLESCGANDPRSFSGVCCALFTPSVRVEAGDSVCEVVGGAGGCEEERQKTLFWTMNPHKTTSYLQKKTNQSAQIPVGSLID